MHTAESFATSGPGTNRLRQVPLWVEHHFPGLVVVIVLAALARGAVSFVLPGPARAVVSEVTVGIIFGLLLANLVALPKMTRAGIKFSVGTLLRLGIVLLGAQLSFASVVTTGLGALVSILIGMTVALLFAVGVGRLFKLPAKLCVLIGVGTAVCGNSAILATSPVIEAEERDTSFAVATITFFGMLAVLFYPVIGRLAGFSDTFFGHWAGMAVNDTSQVVATGFEYSKAAGEIATIVKLTRNTLMGPLIVIIGAIYLRVSAVRSAENSRKASRLGVLKIVPLFVLGFLGTALLNTVGLIPKETGAMLNDGAKTLILLALVGLGLSTNFGQMRKVGLKPFYLGLATAMLLSALALILISLTVGG